jgi:two-component system, NtrC family, nitrogen regulation response regulator NtrX
MMGGVSQQARVRHSLLVVDDEPDIRSMVADILEDEGYEVMLAEHAVAARQSVRRKRPDLVLLDIWMPDTDGLSLLKEWVGGGGLPCPVVMMSGHGTVETAVEATRLGAYDFIEKPLSLAKLLLVVERALEAERLRWELSGLRQRADPVLQPLGDSRPMQALRAQVSRIAGHDTPVLISGEAGTGKRTIARYLHALSRRAKGPFIEVAAGSMSGVGSAVELFGSEQQGRIVYGRLELASRGTLFIDEVADLDLQAQTRLISALSSRRFHRVGGAEPVQIDVRVVAASRVDLKVEVREGRFREDLYYQLNVLPLRIPPLRDHLEDLTALVEAQLQHLSAQDGLQKRRFSEAALLRLGRHYWPGNVRELKNLVQRLLILGDGPDVSLNEVEMALGASQGAEARLAAHDDPGVLRACDLDKPLREAREAFERRYLEHQLAAVYGSVGELAKLSGLERTHLYRKLKALGIDPSEFQKS